MSQENTARLNIEFRSINVNRAVADADAVKQRVSAMFRDTYKSAKDSAAVFEEDQRQMHAAWMRRLKEREQADKVQQRQAGLSARAEIEKTRARERQLEAEKRASFKLGVATQIVQIRAAASEELAIKKAALQQELVAARAAARERALLNRQAAGGQGSTAGTRVMLGAVAGQGFSVGGIASVNPMAAGAVAAAYMVKNATQDLVREATKWEKFKVALTDIEGSAMKADVALNNLYQIAKQPGIGLLQAQQTYVQYRALNVEGAKAEKTIKAIANAVALSGGGATEFERVNYQIVQMLSKGKVLEEDLRIMRNSMPRLTVAMREAFGATTAEGIRKAGVNAEDFLAGIVAQFEKLPKASQTLESAQENAATAMSKLKASLVPDKEVKAAIQGFTAVVEAVTKMNDKLTEASENKFWSKYSLLALISANANISAKEQDYRQTQRTINASKGAIGKAQNEYGFGAEQLSAMYLPESTSFTNAAASFAAYQATVDAGKKKTLEADASIVLENQKLAIALSNANEYEKQRRTVAVEYASKIKEAKIDEDRIALAKQRGLQIALINKKQREEEAKLVSNLAVETDKMRIQAMNASDFEKQRLQIGVEYEVKMREVTDATARASLEDQKRLAIAVAKDKYLKDELSTLRGIQAENDKLGISGSGKNAFEKERDLLNLEYDARIAAAGNSDEEALLKKQRSLKMSDVDTRQDVFNRDMQTKNLPESERIRIEYENQRKIITEMTRITGEERNALMKKANDNYLAQQRELTVKSSEVFLTGTSSLFDALAGTAEGVMGKQSEAYKAMFVTSKAFAIANASLQVANAIANAAGGLPFPANLAAMGQVAAATAGLVSNINALSFSGVFDKGGYIPQGSFGIAGENGPEFVRGPAYVTSTANTAKAMQSSQSSEMKVTVNNFSSESVATRKTDDGSLEIIIGRAVAAAEERIASGIATGSGRVARSMEATYGVRR